jgi:hypothetical protein
MTKLIKASIFILQVHPRKGRNSENYRWERPFIGIKKNDNKYIDTSLSNFEIMKSKTIEF